MNKLISFGIVALLLLTTVVSAVSITENTTYTYDGRELKETTLTYFRWYWNQLKDYGNLIDKANTLRKENLELQQEIIILKSRHCSSGSHTEYITNTEFIQCSECAERPVCLPYYRKYVDDGTDSCGCAINPRCVPNNHIEIIEEIAR